VKFSFENEVTAKPRRSKRDAEMQKSKQARNLNHLVSS
jgi:hypothetical protein